MAPEQTSFVTRPASTKNQRQDLLSQLESFQTSLRTSNTNAFKTQVEVPPKPFFASNSQGLDSLEKSISNKMRSFQQDLKNSVTSPFIRNKSPSKIRFYQTSGANSPSKRASDPFKPILSSSIFKRQLKEDVSNVVDSIAPVSPLKKPKRLPEATIVEPMKIEFGTFSKLSSSNYKPLDLSLTRIPLGGKNLSSGGLFDSMRRKDEGKAGKSSFLLKQRESLQNSVDLSIITETSERLKSLSSKEIEGLSSGQIRELLNLANLIAKIAKNSKHYA